ncbi:MAG: hypothetical protein HEQ35_01720 [Gloeotrichia echinulata IR180]
MVHKYALMKNLWLGTLLFFPTAMLTEIHTAIAQNVNPPVVKLQTVPLTPKQLERLNKALEWRHKQYDPVEKMLRVPFSSPGYHTQLTGGMVHPTKNSLDYAVALLDTQDETYRKRAEDILRRIIALQDQNPNSKTYGIWSWYLEEPLAKMSPPDWNWADFLGTQLLQVSLYHRHRLAPDLAKKLDQAIVHAARSIQRRNVSLGYTNIAIMGTYVTLVTAETYNIPDLRNYALDRLQRFYDYTQKMGGFPEYNSPTYNVTNLESLGRLRLHVKNTNAKKLVGDLYRLAWEEIAYHFHAPTRQWAGPHSRNYKTLLGTRVLDIIQRATEGRVNFRLDTSPTLEEHRLPLPAPRDLEGYFTFLNQARTFVENLDIGGFKTILTTYLHPAFTIGSVNYSDLWNQRRSLLAYWGTSEKPSYLHLRFLHDGYDFAAAQLFSVQNKERVLAGINFATNGGDTHIVFDKLKDGVIKAKDLRLRFEFGGEAGKNQLQLPKDLKSPVNLNVGNLYFQIAVPYAQFGNTSGTWQVGKTDTTSYLDLVLYSGQQKTIRLGDLKQAGIGFALQMGTKQYKSVPNVTATVSSDILKLKWNNLVLPILIKPNTQSNSINLTR